MGFTAKFNRPANLAAGSYNAILQAVNDCQITFGDEPPKDGLEFVYKILGGSDEVLNRRVSKTISERGNLYRDLKAMIGSKLTAETLQDDNLLASAINSCIGKLFILVVDVNDKGFNKVVSIAAAPTGGYQGAPASNEVAKAQVKQESLPHVELDDDDIPF